MLGCSLGVEDLRYQVFQQIIKSNDVLATYF